MLREAPGLRIELRRGIFTSPQWRVWKTKTTYWDFPCPNHVEQLATQRTAPVRIGGTVEKGTLWWFRDRYYWETEGLAPDDVLALLVEKARRKQAQLDRARGLTQRSTADREAKQQHVESRLAHVEGLNADLGEAVGMLEGLLAVALSRDASVDFEDIKETPTLLEFDPGGVGQPLPKPHRRDQSPSPLSPFERLKPGRKERHEAAVREQLAASEAEYRREVELWELDEAHRVRALDEARREHDRMRDEVTQRVAAQNREVDDLRARLQQGEPEAIALHCALVLDSSPYPEAFPKRHRIAFVPESRQVVVEYELPPVSIVPNVKGYRYVRARDAIEESTRPQSQSRSLYTQVVAQIALRTLYELFQGDRLDNLETIVLNCYVDTTDPATGRPTRRHLVTVRAAKEMFNGLDLENVEPLHCLRHLNAAVSRSPHELLPVRPILEFDMVDPRFIQDTHVLAALDQRPNLMELSPTEFEGLISNLFQKMGLETRQTQASRDGGVDCVAYDPRPIFGGKVVIQAKRYRGTVGVSAVRDLFGTMQNEGASKGILVTTSGYGSASFEFAEGKPLELLSGSHLLHLLSEHAGLDARIEPPEDWVDPVADAEVGQQPSP